MNVTIDYLRTTYVPHLSRADAWRAFQAADLAFRLRILVAATSLRHSGTFVQASLDGVLQMDVLYYFDVYIVNAGTRVAPRCARCFDNVDRHAQTKCLWGPHNYEDLP